jgi:hypothetical protein
MSVRVAAEEAQLRVPPPHARILADEHERAARVPDVGECAIGARHAALGVGAQREGEPVTRGKALVGGDAVVVDADHRNARGLRAGA